MNDNTVPMIFNTKQKFKNEQSENAQRFKF